MLSRRQLGALVSRRSSLLSHFVPIFDLPYLRQSAAGVILIIKKLAQRCHLLHLLVQSLGEVKERERNHTGPSDPATPYYALVVEAGPAHHKERPEEHKG